MASSRRQYPFHLIEPKWQQFWDEQQTFRAWNPGEQIPENHPFAKRHGADSMVAGRKAPPKFYILDMFPYPSGAGLHVGHPEGYTATDILARYKRAQGLHVLHPMGWDAFGLPAEQYAIKTGRHPRQTTEANIATFKRQIQSLGFSYDWSRELATTDPDYFKWTQWIFLKLYNSWFNPETNRAEPIETLKYSVELESSAGVPPANPAETAGLLASKRRTWCDSKRLAYVSEQPVWWCEQLGTVLANEEVVDGKSEVGGFPVVRKPMRQWMLRITAYAEKLLTDLDTIDWTGSLKEMQRNWIGRSEGAEVDFQIADCADCGLRIRKSEFACSRHGRTHCLARLTWCCHRNTGSLTKSPRRNSAKRLPNTKLQSQKNPTSNAPNWQRKKLAFSPALTPSIPSTARRFPSGLPITFSPVTAPAPSWLCRRMTRATSSSPPNSICPSSRSSSRLTQKPIGMGSWMTEPR